LHILKQLSEFNPYIKCSGLTILTTSFKESIVLNCYREKPGDSVYVDLDMKKVPLLLNYSQCKLFLGDYYAVIEHTTEVLKKDPGKC
jgi:hypothetical protein